MFLAEKRVIKNYHFKNFRRGCKMPKKEIKEQIFIHLPKTALSLLITIITITSIIIIIIIILVITIQTLTLIKQKKKTFNQKIVLTIIT